MIREAIAALPTAPQPRPFPSWARLGRPPERTTDAAFLAGAGLGSLHAIARSEDPPATLWRQRLALTAAASARMAGRREDETALRDAWYLRGSGELGPAGRVLEAWWRLGERAASSPGDWMLTVAAPLELAVDAGLLEVFAAAEGLSAGQQTAVAAAAEIAALTIEQRPGAEALALWLADAVLAQRLKWPAPVPLLAPYIRRSELSIAPRLFAGDDTWLKTCCLAYARAAANACDLFADLIRRADRLRAVAPQLRAKGAARAVVILLHEDAISPASTTIWMSDRAARRLFERLVTLGAMRELTGRPTFRLYGL
jgi:hypothetical protein